MDYLDQLLPALATVVGVVIGARLSFQQSATQALWSLRREAYGAILSNLAAVDRICAWADDCIAENADRYFNSERYSEHNGLIAPHMKAVRDRFSDDYLILSNDFIFAFESLMVELEGDPNSIPPEEHDQFVAALRKDRPKLMAIARKEISSIEVAGTARTWLSALRIPLLTQRRRSKAVRASLGTR